MFRVSAMKTYYLEPVAMGQGVRQELEIWWN